MIEAPLGPLAVIAGAGSGKSETMAARLVWLVANGKVVRGYLGILMQDMTPDLEKKLGVDATGGVWVTMVAPDTPADQAGMRRGDVITRFDGEPVGHKNALNRLRQRVARTSPGKTVSIELLRNDKRMNVDVMIKERPVAQ